KRLAVSWRLSLCVVGKRGRNSMLTGKTVLITGASQGVGRGLALAAGAAGASVLVTARNLDAAQGVVGEIAAAGGRAAAYRCDVIDRMEVGGAVQAAIGAFGAL